jgi:hypothetical protein
MIEINNKHMSLTSDDKVIATAPSSRHAAANSQGAWIVSSYPVRCQNRTCRLDLLFYARRSCSFVR